jgi:hypothetical protein
LTARVRIIDGSAFLALRRGGHHAVARQLHAKVGRRHKRSSRSRAAEFMELPRVSVEEKDPFKRRARAQQIERTSNLNVRVAEAATGNNQQPGFIELSSGRVRLRHQADLAIHAFLNRVVSWP